LASAGVFEQARVVDRDARGGGECREKLLVVVGERARRVLGHVDVAVDLVAYPDRDAEKTVHFRMPRRKPARPGIGAEMFEADRARVVDERAEDAVTFGQMPDDLGILRRHTHMDELLETPVGRENPQGRVPGTDQVERDLGDAPEHRGEIGQLHDSLRRVEKTAQPPLRRHDPLCGAQQFGDRVIEVGLRCVGKSDAFVVVSHRVACPCQLRRSLPGALVRSGRFSEGPSALPQIAVGPQHSPDAAPIIVRAKPREQSCLKR